MRQAIHSIRSWQVRTWPARAWQAIPAKLRSNHRLFTLALLLGAIAIIGVGVGPRGAHAQLGTTPTPTPTPPDYSKVGNALAGVTHLLRQDDLIVNMGQYNDVDARLGLYPARISAFTTANSSGTQNYDGFAIPGICDSCALFSMYRSQDDSTIVTGRFFHTATDTAVSFPAFRGDQWNVLDIMTGVVNSNRNASFSWTATQPLPYAGYVRSQGIAADFNQDGYDDLLMAYSNSDSRLAGNARMQIATANDVDDPSQGFNFGSEQQLGTVDPILSVTVGDFNGDGQKDIAYAAVGDDNELRFYVLSVDPQTLAITRQFVTPVDNLRSDYRAQQIQIVAGNFKGGLNQQIVVVNPLKSNYHTALRVYDFNQNSYVPILESMWDSGAPATIVKLLASKFQWESLYDSLVFMQTSPNGADPSFSWIYLLTVDPKTYAITKTSTLDVQSGLRESSRKTVALDIAVGNFNNRQPDPDDSTQTLTDPNLQLAVAFAYDGWQPNDPGSLINQTPNYVSDYVAGYVSIVQVVDQQTQKLSFSLRSTNPVLPPSGNRTEYFRKLTINAADLQGRSMRLGGGYKVTVDRAAPTTIIAAPPMHADYVTPNGKTVPNVLNLSLVPDAFKSSYEQEDSTDALSTTTQTSSSTFSGEESLSGTIALGKFDDSGELQNGVKITDTFKFKQDIENSTENKNGTFGSTEFKISEETGLSDVIWFKDTSYYLYVFEVLGQTVCPADKPNCQPSERLPMRLMFSAPKQASVERMASDTVEWYQPPWEYGNLLSYPAGLSQLKQYIPDIQLLTQENSTFFTDDSATTFQTTWTNGKTTGQTVTHKRLFTEDNDLSIEYANDVNFFGYGGKGKVEADLDFGGSQGTESLQESETTTQSSTGITVSKTASFASPFTYKYAFSPYIFGKQEPVGFSDPAISSNDLLTFGTLRSAFTADPLNDKAGGWWKQTYTVPDVALNHPNRWEYTSKPKPLKDDPPPNCIGIDTSTMSCVTPADRDPENPWLDEFHDMRGFFITDARSPGEGPQKQRATAGDQLALQARVYNYSFAKMPAGTKVMVQFFGMPWNINHNVPADALIDADGKLVRDANGKVVDPGGKSFPVGFTRTLDAIPPFSNDEGAPLNWTLASTTFDTTEYANQDIVFWVMVWMQAPDFTIVKEPLGKGLTDTLTEDYFYWFNVIATYYEEMVDDPLGGPDKVTFSNNIGFYRSALTILPKGAATALRATAANGRSSLEQVKVESVKVESASIKLGKAAKIHVTLKNGAEAVPGATVYFYDGDPAQGGKLFDVERIAHLRPNAKPKASVVYRPKQCGAHEIFVKVTQGGDVIATGKAAQAFQVECETPVCATQTCLKAAQYYALHLNGLPRGSVTITGVSPMNQVNTSNAGQMRILLQGGTATSQRFNQQFVTLQLNLLGANDPSRQAEQSNLLCYGVNFQPAQLSTGFSLNPSMTIGELLNQARIAARGGNAIDQRMLATLMQMLNGDDPSGRCK